MSRRCSISKVKRQIGHRVSHANNKRKHAFDVNLQARRIYLADEKRYVRVRVSTRMLRTIDKLGLKEAMRKYKVSVADLRA